MKKIYEKNCLEMIRGHRVFIEGSINNADMELFITAAFLTNQ